MMWIERLDYEIYSREGSQDNVSFLWHSGVAGKLGKVWVMADHQAALWCWMKKCRPDQHYNFMHIDRHYDLCASFEQRDLEPFRDYLNLPYRNCMRLKKQNSNIRVLTCDNYIMIGKQLYPNWFHTNMFITHKVGTKELNAYRGYEPLKIHEADPINIASNVRCYIENASDDIFFFEGRDCALKWIVNLDLDVFFSEENKIQLFSDDYIRHVAESLQQSLKNIEALTIAISPDWIFGSTLKEKMDTGFRVLKIMSETLKCLRGFEKDRIRLL